VLNTNDEVNGAGAQQSCKKDKGINRKVVMYFIMVTSHKFRG